MIIQNDHTTLKQTELADIPVDEFSAHSVVRFDSKGAVKTLVEHGCPLDDAIEIVRTIPPRFPIVVECQSGMPVKSVLLHLLQQYRRSKRKMQGQRSLNSAIASAYDIVQFLDHLDAVGHDFDDTLDQHVIDGFAEAMTLLPSRWTGRVVSKATIARRVATVSTYCKSTFFRDLGTVDFDPKLVPGYGRIHDAGIRPFVPEDWLRLVKELGSMPSQRSNDPRGSVLRLMCEWAIWTAGRRTEISTLPLSAVLDHAEGLYDLGGDVARRVRITNTKGRVPRDLIVPAGLLRETLIYVRGERSAAMDARQVVEHDRLFVMPEGGARAGRPVKPETLSRWFRNAVNSSDLHRRDWATGGSSRTDRPYVFHDLRHTAAVWMYVAFSHAGVTTPWRYVQARLGHLHLRTTETVYLAFVDEQEAQIADVLNAQYSRWASA